MRAVVSVRRAELPRAMRVARSIHRAATTMPTPTRGHVCIAIHQGTNDVAGVASEIERAVRRELAR